MSEHTIPMSNRESWYTTDLTLDGISYVFRAMWCERERRWYYDIETSDGTAIATGRKLVVDTPLLVRETSALAPKGILSLFDRTGKGQDADLRDLGNRCILIYIDAEDVVA